MEARVTIELGGDDGSTIMRTSRVAPVVGTRLAIGDDPDEVANQLRTGWRRFSAEQKLNPMRPGVVITVEIANRDGRVRETFEGKRPEGDRPSDAQVVRYALTRLGYCWTGSRKLAEPDEAP